MKRGGCGAICRLSGNGVEHRRVSKPALSPVGLDTIEAGGAQILSGQYNYE